MSMVGELAKVLIAPSASALGDRLAPIVGETAMTLEGQVAQVEVRAVNDGLSVNRNQRIHGNSGLMWGVGMLGVLFGYAVVNDGTKRK